MAAVAKVTSASNSRCSPDDSPGESLGESPADLDASAALMRIRLRFGESERANKSKRSSLRLSGDARSQRMASYLSLSFADEDRSGCLSVRKLRL